MKFALIGLCLTSLFNPVFSEETIKECSKDFWRTATLEDTQTLRNSNTLCSTESLTRILHVAALNASPEVFRAFLDKNLNSGLHLNLRDYRQRTALLMAASKGKSDNLTALIDASASISIPDEDGFTPLVCALVDNEPQTSMILIAAGADVNAATNSGSTALTEAAGRGDDSMVQALLAAGADINAKTSSGYTALMWAAGWGHSSIVQTLLAAGADIGPALSYAIEMQNRKMTELLLHARYKAIINMGRE